MQHNYTPKQIARFWSKVDKSGGSDSCWIWTAGRNHGYGWVRWNGRPMNAQRVAWILTHGDPGDLHVLHRCDVPACCNPSHLFLGTDADNMHDMDAKGRRVTSDRRGEKHPKHKLTIDQVAEIRLLYAQGGITQDALATRYGVESPCIWKIVRRKTWTS